jgi:predicted  nucleic acid-binding Zn-ribbon protein
MTAAPAVLMREIHRLRRFARDLQEQLDRFPRQLKIQQAKLERQENQLKESQEALKKLKVAILEKEASLKTAHSQIKKHEKQLNEAADKKEFDALKAQIAADQGQVKTLEEEAFLAMTESEERAAQLPEEAKALERARAEFAEWEKSARQRSAEQSAQLQETLARLKEVEADVPADLKTQYNRGVNAMGPDALAPVENRTCTACRTEITAQTYNNLLQNQFVVCRSCARILYLPETLGAEE